MTGDIVKTCVYSWKIRCIILQKMNIKPQSDYPIII